MDDELVDCVENHGDDEQLSYILPALVQQLISLPGLKEDTP
jgi:hypothetical protein